MINPFKDVNWNPDVAARRTFAKSLVIGFPCIALLLLAAKRAATGLWQPGPPMWIGGVGAGLGVLFYAVPAISKPFYLAWYFVACCMGLVISNVLLGGFFYLVVTPAGWLKRALGKNNLRKGFDKQAATYWKDAEKITDPSRYYRQF